MKYSYKLTEKLTGVAKNLIVSVLCSSQFTAINSVIWLNSSIQRNTHRVTPEQLLLLQATAFVSRVTSIIMPELPSSEEIAQCISTMSRISPCDLHTLSPKLTEAGHALFGRSIKVSLFGEEDVVSFFRQKEDYKSLLKKLERVHDEVQRAHANFVEVIDFPVNFKKRKALY